MLIQHLLCPLNMTRVQKCWSRQSGIVLTVIMVSLVVRHGDQSCWLKVWFTVYLKHIYNSNPFLEALMRWIQPNPLIMFPSLKPTWFNSQKLLGRVLAQIVSVICWLGANKCSWLFDNKSFCLFMLEILHWHHECYPNIWIHLQTLTSPMLVHHHQQYLS